MVNLHRKFSGSQTLLRGSLKYKLNCALSLMALSRFYDQPLRLFEKRSSYHSAKTNRTRQIHRGWLYRLCERVPYTKVQCYLKELLRSVKAANQEAERRKLENYLISLRQLTTERKESQINFFEGTVLM